MQTRAYVRPALGAAVVVVVVALVVWLASGSSLFGGSDTAGRADASANPTTADQAEDEPSPSAGVQPDAVAPSTLPIATRPGATLVPTLVAPQASLDATSTYSDGVEVTVGGATRTKVEAGGPGSISATLTSLEVTVANRSTSVLDLNRVVISVVYGAAPGRLADPSYELDDQDLSGSLRPGRTATTRYAFNIPDEGLSDVTVSVDLDGVHVPVLFTGSVPVLDQHDPLDLGIAGATTTPGATP